jgi:hypothetical protein
MPNHTQARAERRAEERAERDRNRRLRRLALLAIADMAENDSTISGATLCLPDGSVEFIDAGLLRRGGTA